MKLTRLKTPTRSSICSSRNAQSRTKCKLSESLFRCRMDFQKYGFMNIKMNLIIEFNHVKMNHEISFMIVTICEIILTIKKKFFNYNANFNYNARKQTFCSNTVEQFGKLNSGTFIGK